jgi:glycosyltransferase involved in cell wall biosynthesis
MNKMRILYIGCGFHPRISGGATQIQWEILNSGQKLGYIPTIFQSGLYDFKNKLYLKERSIDDSVLLFDLMNSPNMPGNRNPKSEVSNESILKLCRRVLQDVKPDIVHIHELTYLCSVLIDECRNYGIPTVKTIHNYWDVCPQRDLLYNGETVCTNYFEGGRCVDCQLTLKHRPWQAAIWNILYGKSIFVIAKRIWRGWQGFQSFSEKYIHKVDNNKSNNMEPEYRELAIEYKRRRAGFVRSLNSLNRIHVYSLRSKNILVSYGVLKDKFTYIPVATDAIDKIQSRPLYNGSIPINFGYRGGIAPNKGIHILIDAFKQLDQKKARLIIYGTGPAKYISDLKDLSKGSCVEFMGAYSPENLSEVNSLIDVGVIPSIWEELFGLVGVEYIQSRVPIIASEIGGIPEYVHHGINGLLVKPGDQSSLKQAMQSIIDQPSTICKMQNNMARWTSVADMTQSLGDLYMDMLTR